MWNVAELTDSNLLPFFLLFVRIVTLLALLPVFGTSAPKSAMAALSFFTTILLFPVTDISHVQDVEVDLLHFAELVAQEALIGILTSLLILILFSAVQLAGYIIGFEIGFGIINVLDPLSGEQVSIFAQFMNMFALLLFFTLNIHHILLTGFAQSCVLIPIGKVSFPSEIGELLNYATDYLFLVGLKLAAPIFVTLILKQAAMGILARTVPQINIFIVGFPITIGFGLFAMSLLMIYYQEILTIHFLTMASNVETLLQLLMP
ncbi:MAG: flagellar biosynthetic protein FliR [Nitrospinota bacterium]